MIRPLASVLFSMTAPVFAQDLGVGSASATVLELLPLHGLNCKALEASDVPFGTLLRRTSPRNLLRDPDDTARFDPSELREYLQILQGKAAEEGRVELMLPGDTLMVRTTKDLLPAVRQQLKEVLAVVLRPIVIDASVYAWETDDAPHTALSPSELAEVLRGRQALWSASAQVTSNHTAAFRQERWTTYVQGVASEVAQKMDVGFASMDAFFEGLVANVEVHAVAGTQDLVLFGQLALAARRGEPRSMSTGIGNQPNLDLPLLETSLGTFAGRVPSGGALVCVDRGLAAGGARLLIVFTPRYPTPGSNQQVQGAGIFPVSALTSPSLLRRVTVQKSGDDPPDFDSVGSESPPFGHLEPELLIDLVRTAVAPAGEDEHFRLRCAGGFLMAHGTAQQVAAVEATVRAIQDRLLRNVEVRCLATATESHDAGMFTGAPAGPTVTLHELAVPAMPGRAVAWFRGLETNVIRCFRVNIAQEAFSLYPEIAAARSGLLLSATCAPGVDDPTASLFLHFEHVAEPTVRDTKPQGNSMLTVRAVRDAGHSGPIADGKLVELGQGPPVSIDGHPFRTALQASVTFR